MQNALTGINGFAQVRPGLIVVDISSQLFFQMVIAEFLRAQPTHNLITRLGKLAILSPQIKWTLASTRAILTTVCRHLFTFVKNRFISEKTTTVCLKKLVVIICQILTISSFVLLYSMFELFCLGQNSASGLLSLNCFCLIIVLWAWRIEFSVLAQNLCLQCA